MHVFVTGGSGLTGPAIVAELIAAGHTVTGLARSDDAASRLQGLGAETLRGSLEDPGSLREGARAADGVIHMGFGGSFADPEDGRISTEQDAPDPESIASFRVPGEQACLAFADEGVRSSVVRVAPTVRDANRWPAIHRLDAASLFRLALEKAPSGSALHGAGESAITRKSIAEHIAWILQIPTAFLTLEQAADHLVDPFLARAFVTDAPASSTRTQTLLGWTPTHATLLEDMETGDYFAQQTARPRSAPHRDHSQS